jgi:hypothetical protein
MKPKEIAFTIVADSKTLSGRVFPTYDEAAKCIEVERESYLRGGVVPPEMHISIQQDPLVVYRHLTESIRSYRNSDVAIVEPMVVQFLRSDRYAVLPNAELTPAHYGEDPFITWGSVDGVTEMLVRLGLSDLLFGEGED